MKSALSILLCVLFSSIAFGSGEERIRQQFVEYSTQQPQGESSVKRFLNGIREDGTWADIDYASQRRGGWPTRNHLERVKTLAMAYATEDSKHFQKPAVRDAALRGLRHWIEKDYRNPNWWYARIGIPRSMAAAMILLGDDLPDDVLKKARPILLRSKMGMTGQNQVWCAGNNVMIGLLYDEPERMKLAVAAIGSELRVATEEGIQPDWSFHQHGPQQQFGNYGLSFAGDMIQWASILRGTDYALTGEKLEILRHYLLEGASWIIWNGRMDLSGCGRQIDQGEQASKGRATIGQLERMKKIDPEYGVRYDAVLERLGFKPFWRSEMGVQRRPDWYASVKMSSTRVIGAETCNAENMQGLHLGDGVLLTYIDGTEYEDIVPLWDWKCLPGTTCDQGLKQLEPKGWKGGYGGSDFCGVLGGGETGMAAMVYKRNALSAHKAWFFLKDHIVCLGAGISGDTKGAVYTSVEQAWFKGGVGQGKNVVQHNGIAYQVLDGTPEFEVCEVEGNWLACFPTRSGRPAAGKVFNMWIDHGVSPENASYAYKVFPNVGKEASAFTSAVLENTTKVQAVEIDGGLQAVFYEAGKVALKNGIIIGVDGACLLSIGNGRLTVADPAHELQSLGVEVNGVVKKIDLPQGADKGKQVSQLINGE